MPTSFGLTRAATPIKALVDVLLICTINRKIDKQLARKSGRLRLVCVFSYGL